LVNCLRDIPMTQFSIPWILSLNHLSHFWGQVQKDLDQNMLARIDQFNFGLANTIASVSFLNTIPLIKTDATGISTFKEAGGSTNLYIIGSGLKKSDDRPTAFLSGATVKSNYTTLWGVIREGIALDIPNASMSLLEVTIPNSLIPDDYGPTDFSLTLKLREGSNLVGWPKYSEQSIPLHVCGKLQKYKAVIAVWASGKQYVRDRRPLTDLIHGGCAGGRTNDSGNVCLPDQPPSGWEFDMADPDYGIVWQGSSFEGYVDYHHYGVGRRCMTCYCDGSQGNAHCNLMGLQMKIRRLADLDPCAAKWSSPEPIALTYGRLIQTDVHDQIVASGGSGGVGCDELKAQYAPTSHVTITILDSNGKVVETEDLREEIEATALSGAATFTRHSSGRIDMHLDPKCSWSPVPSGN